MKPVENKENQYTTEDVARAFLLCEELGEQHAGPTRTKYDCAGEILKRWWNDLEDGVMASPLDLDICFHVWQIPPRRSAAGQMGLSGGAIRQTIIELLKMKPKTGQGPDQQKQENLELFAEAGIAGLPLR